MCGIAGYISFSPLADNTLKAMLDAIYHRGPDSEGSYSDRYYSAGMRRLSINDVAHGAQPFYNEDKSVVVFYNGEIYNYAHLKKQLLAQGHKIETHCDGEIIPHLYEEYSTDLFSYLDGMFAISVWDVKKQQLILGRDQAGEKPLYYESLEKNGLLYGSELKSFSKFPLHDAGINLQAIWDFPTFLWVPEPDTIYKKVQALMPGHILIWQNGSTKIQRYSNRFVQNIEGLSERELIDVVRDTVSKSVKDRLLSDVPIGAFLSGGLDSSIVATIASQNVKQLDTFCVAFEDLSDPYHGRADESVDAAFYSQILGTNHHTIHVTEHIFEQSLSAFCEYGDQPFAVSSGLGIFAIAKAAKEAGISVLLSGDGADECFGGYSWYKYLNKLTSSHAGSSLGKGVSFQSFGLTVEQRLSAMEAMTPSERAYAWHYYAAEIEKSNLFNNNVFDSVSSSIRWFSDFKNGTKWSPEDYIAQDRAFYFPNEMLKKVDRMTMAHSVEGRACFASPGVLGLAEQLRYSHCVRNDTLKWVLRDAFSDLLPGSVTGRPKHGFNVPIDHWLKGKWSDLLCHAFSRDSALFHCGLIQDKSLGYAIKMRDDKNRLNGHTLFCYIMLNMWLEQNNIYHIG